MRDLDPIFLEKRIENIEKNSDPSKVNKLEEKVSTFAFRVNDGKNQLSNDDGETWTDFNSGATVDELWVNPSPTQNMAGATYIWYFDTDYDYFLIECYQHTTARVVVSKVLCKLDETVFAGCNNNGQGFSRSFQIKAGGKVIVGAGMGGTTTNVNSICIIKRILGIKGLNIE